MSQRGLLADMVTEEDALRSALDAAAKARAANAAAGAQERALRQMSPAERAKLQAQSSECAAMALALGGRGVAPYYAQCMDDGTHQKPQGSAPFAYGAQGKRTPESVAPVTKKPAAEQGHSPCSPSAFAGAMGAAVKRVPTQTPFEQEAAASAMGFAAVGAAMIQLQKCATSQQKPASSPVKASASKARAGRGASTPPGWSPFE